MVQFSCRMLTSCRISVIKICYQEMASGSRLEKGIVTAVVVCKVCR
jgi:hypothetical protein